MFVDYGSTLNSQNQVIGIPGIARQKSGEGLGGGFGLRADTGFGIGRVEIGFSDRGDVQGHISFGERF